MSEQPDDIAAIGITFEQLAAVEDEFEDIDSQVIKNQYNLSAAAYKKRAEIIAKIPHFWGIVLEACPEEIEPFIQPQDSQILAESLTSLSVDRPEIANGKDGNPRTISIKFDFAPNDFFSNTTLEKTFHWRRASDGWTGHVSEPVAIQWKKGKDLSEGLNDMAVKLFEARKKAGDFLKTDLPEYKPLEEKLQTANAQNTSFFTWFGFVSDRRYVTAEESEKAEAEYQAKRAKGETALPEETEEDDDEGDDDKDDDSAVEVHEMGSHLAISIAEDLWPGAIKYFTSAQEMDEMSDGDFEEMDMDELEGMDGIEELSDSEAEPVDIRALIGDKPGKGGDRKASGSGAPAAKKQKK